LHAQPAGAQAEVLFRNGKELMKQHQYAEACARFEAAEKLDPTTTTIVALADCREQNGQYASAWGLYLRAERELRGLTDAPGTQLHSLMKDRADKLSPRVSHMTVKVGSADQQPTGLEVLWDDDHVDAGAWNQPL